MSLRGVSSQLVQFRLVECRAVSRSLVWSHGMKFRFVSWSAVFDRGVGCHLAESSINSWSLVSWSIVQSRGVSFRLMKWSLVSYHGVLS